MKNELMDKITLVQGDITQIQVDAIVNAANSSLMGGGGVDGAIHRAAGKELLAECRTIGGCPTGEARLTRGYNLPAKYIIHTVGPIYRGVSRDAELLADCYRNCFRIALDNRIATLAFPAISCGIYGYPIEKACAIALNITREYLKQYTLIKKVIFTLFSEKDLKIYQAQLEKTVM